MEMKIIEKFGKDIMVYKVPEFINKNKNTGNKLDDFEILDILDDGEYSKVVKVKSKINFGIYAMKKIFKGIIEYHNLKKDIDFIMKCNHPNIIKYFNYFVEENYVYIIMEYMNNSDLETYRELNDTYNEKISDKKFWKILFKSLCVLDFIHNEKRKLQLQLKNIFVDNDYNIKIGIFSLYSMINYQKDKLDHLILLQSLNRLLRRGYYDDTYENRAELISFISYWENESKNVTSHKVMISAKELYINYYVKNSAINAIINCFNNYKDIKIYFSNNYLKNLIYSDENDNNKILAKEFLNIIQILNDNKRKKEEKDFGLYEFRKALENSGFYIENDCAEIYPESLIPFILMKINSELNEIKEEENEKYDQKRFIILGRKTNFFRLENDEDSAFKLIYNIYNEKISSIISRNFLSFIKKRIHCQQCGYIGIYFSWVYFIHVPIRNDKTNLIDYLKINNPKVQKCRLCKKGEEEELWSFYKTANNLIIILDRCKDYEIKTFIDIKENLILNNVYEKTVVNYKLKGIILKKYEKKEYTYYLLNDYNIWISSESGDIINFEFEIKRNLPICLFYEVKTIKASEEELNKIHNALTDQSILNMPKPKSASKIIHNNNNFDQTGLNIRSLNNTLYQKNIDFSSFSSNSIENLNNINKNIESFNKFNNVNNDIYDFQKRDQKRINKNNIILSNNKRQIGFQKQILRDNKPFSQNLIPISENDISENDNNNLQEDKYFNGKAEYFDKINFGYVEGKDFVNIKNNIGLS